MNVHMFVPQNLTIVHERHHEFMENISYDIQEKAKFIIMKMVKKSIVKHLD